MAQRPEKTLGKVERRTEAAIDRAGRFYLPYGREVRDRSFRKFRQIGPFRSSRRSLSGLFKKYCCLDLRKTRNLPKWITV
jgi:hypothetical protein